MLPITLNLPENRDALPLEKAFRFLWARYVIGFDPSKHCQLCLLGRTSARFKMGDFGVPAVIILDEFADFDFIYICGVAHGQRWARNFHLAARHREGAEARGRCYTGQEIVLLNGELIEIPLLPDGFNGKNRSFTTCRNYQFGAAVYQRNARGAAPNPNSDGTYGRRRLNYPSRRTPAKTELSSSSGSDGEMLGGEGVRHPSNGLISSWNCDGRLSIDNYRNR